MHVLIASKRQPNFIKIKFYDFKYLIISFWTKLYRLIWNFQNFTRLKLERNLYKAHLDMHVLIASKRQPNFIKIKFYDFKYLIISFWTKLYRLIWNFQNFTRLKLERNLYREHLDMLVLIASKRQPNVIKLNFMSSNS